MLPACHSLLTDTYYQVKPFVPRRVRWMMRRWRARRVRRHCAAEWPILEAAGSQPTDWPGWPGGKRFAFVLTHDVEGQDGVDRVPALAQVEMKCGFRSSFNFIPEGGYLVPRELREWLVGHGFEVGVHDLNHDGKLYRSKSGFSAKARRINHYLHEWNASGFRSGFMLRQLSWLHELDIEYECSTFDTDPFEPQPTGSKTIFPYWLSRPGGSSSEHRTGYVELPYTLPQDSTLFLLLRERNTDIWRTKTRWIVERGGMVLLNVHPDYIDLTGSGGPMTYPLEYYVGFLKWIRDEFQEQAWNALPGEVSRFVRQHAAISLAVTTHGGNLRANPSANPIKIWIDLENTPHIPFFKPIIRELRNQGHEVVVTARDCYQTCEMASFHGLDYRRIGHHYGRNAFAKIWGLLVRGWQLVCFARRDKPCIALNLGSRSQNLAAKLLRIPAVEVMDYEHTAESVFLRPRWCLKPSVLNGSEEKGRGSERNRSYEGIKEDVYVPEFDPDEAILDILGLRDAKVVVTARPPATEAHYHNPEADILFARFIERALRQPGAITVLLPRNARQEDELREKNPHWFASPRIVLPKGIVNGLNLIWHSDLVVSGGGTMNREAAALGVPVYSVFRGQTGAVDQKLSAQGRLILIESEDDVDQKIHLCPRAKRKIPDHSPSPAFKDILRTLREVIETVRPRLKDAVAST